MGREDWGDDSFEKGKEDRWKKPEGRFPVVSQVQKVDNGDAGGWGNTVSTSERASQCWVCDKEGHMWFTCPNKKRGMGCARCGSTAHRLKKCPQRL